MKYVSLHRDYLKIRKNIHQNETRNMMKLPKKKIIDVLLAGISTTDAKAGVSAWLALPLPALSLLPVLPLLSPLTRSKNPMIDALNTDRNGRIGIVGL
jgi:hypothetical protein